MKQSYCCEKLERTIHFLPYSVKFCCTGAEGPGLYGVDFDSFSTDKVQDAKRNIINSLMRGKLPKQCYGCTDYKEQPVPGFWERFWGVKSLKKINHIIIDHFKECDCNCTYCTQKIIYPNKVKEYDILPIIKMLYANNMIDNDVEVEFQGGSVGIWKEYESVLKELQKQNCKIFNVLTNGIKYEPLLEEIVKTASVNMTVSIDCGTREKFKEIKRSDCFDTVIDNIYRYTRANINVQMKYILLENINDNIEEITKFLDTARAFGCTVFFDLDYRQVYFGNNDKYVLPEKYISLINEIKKYCNENNMNCILNEALRTKLDKS